MAYFEVLHFSEVCVDIVERSVEGVHDNDDDCVENRGEAKQTEEGQMFQVLDQHQWEEENTCYQDPEEGSLACK
jgi:hypothetical protein